MRLLLGSLLAVAAVVPAAHADPYACVNARNSKGVDVVHLCGPDDANDTQGCRGVTSPTPVLPSVSVCSTAF